MTPGYLGPLPRSDVARQAERANDLPSLIAQALFGT